MIKMKALVTLLLGLVLLASCSRRVTPERAAQGGLRCGRYHL